MKYRILFLSVYFLCSLPFNAFAATDDDQAIDIERIVVTADRSQEDVREASKSTTVITSKDIKESNAQTIPGILRTEAGVAIRDYNGTGKQVNVDMQGFGENGPSNMLVLVDGRRVNAIDLSNTDWSQIPLSQVDHIEIVRGASSVLYGDNASGGVINIITKSGAAAPYTTLTTKGGSYSTSSTSVESGGSKNNSTWRFNGEYFNTDGYRKNSDLFRKDFGLRFEHTFDPLLGLAVSFGYHADEYGLPGALKESQLAALGRRATTKPDDRASSEDYFLNTEINNDFGDWGSLKTNISGDVRSANGDYASAGDENDNQIVTLGLRPQYTLKSTLKGKPNTLLLGLDLYHAKDGIADSNAFDHDRIDIAKSSLGLYAQDQFQITNRLLLKAGLRHENTHYLFHQITDAQLKEKSDLNENLFDFGTTYHITKTSDVYIDYSKSFRNPLVDEFFSSNTFGFGGLNASLKAQKGRDIEAGMRHRLWDKLQIDFNYFRHDLKDEIYFNPITFANSNYDRTTHQGGSLQTDLTINNAVSTFLNYTYTCAKFGKGPFKGKRIPAVPQNKASAGFRFSLTEHLKLITTLNIVDKMFCISDVNNTFKPLSGYTTVDMNLRYTLKNFEIFMDLNNIFDEKYSEYGALSASFLPPQERAFYPAAGRNVMAGCRYKF